MALRLKKVDPENRTLEYESIPGVSAEDAREAEQTLKKNEFSFFNVIEQPLGNNELYPVVRTRLGELAVRYEHFADIITEAKAHMKSLKKIYIEAMKSERKMGISFNLGGRTRRRRLRITPGKEDIVEIKKAD